MTDDNIPIMEPPCVTQVADTTAVTGKAKILKSNNMQLYFITQLLLTRRSECFSNQRRY